MQLLPKNQNPDQEMQQERDLEGGEAKERQNKFSGETQATSRWSVSF